MRKRAVAERLDRFLGDGRAVAGHRPCCEGPGLAVHVPQHARRQVAAEAVDRAGAVGRFLKQEDRGAGIADCPQLVEIGHATKVKAAGFDRAVRGGQAGGKDDHLPRHRVKPGLVVLERDPDPDRSAVGRHLTQSDLVKRQSQGIGLRTVDTDDPPFDRAVVAEVEHGGGDGVRADAGGKPSGSKGSDSKGKRAGKIRPPRRQCQTHPKDKRRKRVAARPRFPVQREPDADAAADQHGDPREKAPARRLQRQKWPKEDPCARSSCGHLVTLPTIA